jgi:type II secretory pathway component GspD/PulD (secretin)
LVTGSEDTHAAITNVIKQLDVASGQEPVTKAYPIRLGDPDAISESLIAAFARSRDYSITYQEANETIYVLATPRHQAAIEDMLEAMDQAPPQRSSQQPKLYPLANVSADVAASTVLSITKGQVPSPDVLPNEESNSLVVIASEEQHRLIQETLDQLDGDVRQLEVFQLRLSDPFTIELAISELFAGLQGASEPFVSTDYGTNKLFVRGTAEQLEQIRQLLAKLGESVGGLGQQLGSGKTRRIPFHGDTRAAISQIEAIWPRIRQNSIQVIVPSEGRLRPQLPGGAAPAPADSQDNDPSEARQETSSRRGSARSGSKLVVFQNTTRAALPRQSTDDSPDVIVDEDQEQSLPPILIVPGNDSITISSDDSEALDRLESLLRAMSEVHGGISGNSNFAVFLLRNTGAIEIEVLLKRLFDELPFSRGGMGDLVVVSDERLNALIVHGSVRTREMVAELLEVLDTSELPNPLNVFRPEMISLEHTQASRVMAILENVYRSQLTTVGGRTPLKIPKGIGTSVASVLQQMNAAAAGPVLTLEVDQTSNVLIVRAPPELREEIREFVEQIDKQAATQSNRHVRVIQLKESRSDRMLTALQQFLSAE